MVCMNFLAMPTLKKVRSCFLPPISIMPLRVLNDTFESARIGIAKAGSFERWAAAITTSAIPTSLVSTFPAVFFFFAPGALVVVVASPPVVFFAFVLAMASSVLPCGLLLRARGAQLELLLRAFLVKLLRRFGRRFRFRDHLGFALDPLRGH